MYRLSVMRVILTVNPSVNQEMSASRHDGARLPLTQRVTRVDEYEFAEPLIDIRNHPDQADPLRSELLRELSPGHGLHGRPLTVIARAPPRMTSSWMRRKSWPSCI